MKVDLVVFINAAESPVTRSTSPSFSSAEEGGKYRDAGFILEATPFGVACSHPKAKGVVRVFPWSNIKYVDTSGLELNAALAPKSAATVRRGRKAGSKNLPKGAASGVSLIEQEPS